MKFRKSFADKTQTFLFLFILLSSGQAFAFGSKKPAEATANESTPPNNSELRLNPESLKGLVLSATTSHSILVGLNEVQKSKLNYSAARARLYPSLNFSTVAASLANPSFLIPSVQALLPFLVPSNWFHTASAKRQYQADKTAFRILQKDILASSLSLYLSILRDQKLLRQFQQDLEDLRMLEDSIENRYEFGAANDTELSITRSQRVLAQVRVLETQQFLNQQYLEMKRAIGVEPKRPIVLDEYQMPSDPSEQWTSEKITDESWEKNSSREQLLALRKSAESDGWSKVFAFFGGASITAHTLDLESYPRLSTKNMSAQADFTLSYSQVPALRLANNQLESIDLMIDELKDELSFGVEKFVENLPSLQERKALAEEAESLIISNFQTQLQRYNLGAGASFQDVLNARLSMQQSALKNIEAGRDLDLARVTLHRWLQLGLFASFPELDSKFK